MGLSSILLTIGAMIGSPEAGLAISALVALCALVPAAALGSAFPQYPAAKRQMMEYRGRTTGEETKAP